MRNNSLKMAARLAAATALTGSLTACDGRFGRAADALFSPIGSQPPATQTAATPLPAAPGNPVYIGGSRAANNAAYEQTYGAPIQGSGQTVDTGYQVGYAPSVYEDSAIAQTQINTGAYSAPVTQVSGGYSAYQPAPVEPTYSTAPLSTPVYESEFVTPVETYSAPVTTFPAIGGDVYAPQSSTMVNQDIFSDASYQPDASALLGHSVPMTAMAEPISSQPTGVQTAYVVESSRDIEPLLGTPYGSTASHRYSAPEDQTTMSYGAISHQPLMMEEPLIVSENVQDQSIDVAFLADGYFPIPRAHPVRNTVFHAASLSPPVPVRRPEMAEAILRSPLPLRRPANRMAMSGRAITDAPTLMETPKMIEVPPVFIDEVPEIESGTEVAALASAPSLSIMEAEEFTSQADMAAIEDIVEAPVPDPAPQPEETEIAAIATRNDVSNTLDDIEATELSGTSWRLTMLEGETVDADAELHFDGSSGFAGGQAFCNNYGGEFREKNDGTFDMANIFSTETDCEHFSLERKYIVALEQANKYRVEPGMKELSLMGSDGKAIARFTAF